MKLKSTIGIMLFFLMNIALIFVVFSQDQKVLLILIGLYLIVTVLSLTPLGEAYLCFLAGAKKIPRKDMNIKLIPLVEVVLSKAIVYMPPMVRDIHVRYIEDSSPMAYAIGRKTICVTDGLLKLRDEEIMGALAHELGHLALKHNTWQLLIGGGNIFISGFISIFKMILNFVTFISGVSILPQRSRLVGIILTFFASAINLFFRIYIKVSICFLCWTKRENEFEADQFACEIGFGKQLCNVLDRLNVPERSTLISTLLSTHPTNNERIGRLQEMGVSFSAY